MFRTNFTMIPEIKIPIAPIITATKAPYAMFGDLNSYPWMLTLRSYTDVKEVTSRLFGEILANIADTLLRIRKLP